MQTRVLGVAPAVAALIAAAAPAAALPADVRIKQFAAGERASIRRAGSPEADRPWTETIVSRARSMVGTPYSYGGTTPAAFDCSGFTRWVFLSLGLDLPHSSVAQYALGDAAGYERISSMADLRSGDLVFHATGDPVGHAGIYIGSGMFISSTTSEGVQVRSLHDSYWGPLWVGAVRVVRAG